MDKNSIQKGLYCFLILGCLMARGLESIDQVFTLLKSKDTGIKFINDIPVDISKGQDVLNYQYFYNGAGVAIGDINNDGLPDIYFTANKGPNKLYLNLGSMKFKDITSSAGVGSMKYSTGVVFADINQDGYIDIYVCNGGNSKSKDRENQLYINNGDLTFSEQAKKYGLNDSNYSSQAAFFDYDLDGDLDIYVMNHSIHFRTPIPTIIEQSKDKNFLKSTSGKLFENKNGRFIDVTEQMGLLRYSFGLGLCISDINQDGWPDIYIANDFSVPDFLFINNKGMGFVDEIKDKTNQISWFGMGADIADINNDGLLDIAVLDMAAADHFRGKTLMASMNPKAINYLTNNLGFHHQYMFNSIQLNNGAGHFSNIANLTKTAKTDWSWAALLADFDNDGNKDYFVTNGFRKCTLDNDFQNELKQTKDEYKNKNQPIPIAVANELYNKMPEIKLPNYLFHNKGDLNFEDVASKWGLGKSSYSNGASYADLDLDGDLDLVVNNVDQFASIYRNNLNTIEHHFLRINLTDTKNRSGFYNASVHIYYDGQEQVLEYSPTRGYLSSVEHVLHFGIPVHVKKIDRIVVTLLGGKQIVREDVNVNQILDISIYDEGQDFSRDNIKPYFKELGADLFGVNFKHIENDFDDFEYEGLLPHRQSRFGPFCSVADVNGDGLDDFFVGGAAGQAGVLYLQSKEGKFYVSDSQPWWEDRASEDMNSLFFDIDNDQDLDLYIVSGGGGEFEINSPLLQDRVYINDGKGVFNRNYDAFADDIFESGQQVKAADIDLDGDMDLFVGGRLVPGYYPYSPKSYILINESGTLYNGNDYWGDEIEKKGLITDFLFTDFNLDSQIDLILVGEWTSIYMLENNGEQFVDVSSEYGTNQLKGWWYSIEESDFNQDGAPDYLVGNIGLNTKFKASKENPFHINTNDFDDDNDQDIVLSTYYKGELVPIRGRECSSGEMPFIKEKYPTFEGFANATLEELYTEEKLETSIHLEVNTFASIVLMSNKDGYDYVKLPMNAQVSPINRSIIQDFDNDGNKDIIVGGNMFHTEVETPRYDSGVGLMIKVDRDGNFKPIHSLYSGVFLNKDVKDIDPITIGGKMSFLVCNNNDKMQVFVPND